MSLLDTGQLAALYDLAGPQFVEMLDDFVVSSREALGRLESALVAGDLVSGAEIAHQLKGSSASLGLALFQEQLAQLESALRAGNRPESLEVAGLEGLLAKSVEEVRGYLTGN